MGKYLTEKIGPRDAIYLISYLAAVALAYEFIEKVPLWISQKVLEAALTLVKAPFRITLPAPAEEKPLNYQSLLKALVVGYMVLKIDVADVASAVGKITTSTLTALAGATAV